MSSSMPFNYPTPFLTSSITMIHMLKLRQDIDYLNFRLYLDLSSFFNNILFLSGVQLKSIALYLVVMSLQSPLVCDTFLVFPCFYDLDSWGMLTSCAIEYLPIWVCLMIKLRLWEESHGGEVPFSSHHFRGYMISTTSLMMVN